MDRAEADVTQIIRLCYNDVLRKKAKQLVSLKLSFSANLSTAAFFFFFRTDYMIPQNFTVTLFSCWFRAVD